MYDPTDQIDIYESREQARSPVVKTYAAENINKGSALNPQNNMRILTERIQYRLSEAPQLTYPESLYVLDNSLAGSQYLYNKAGPFYVSDRMIGFTP